MFGKAGLHGTSHWAFSEVSGEGPLLADPVPAVQIQRQDPGP